MIEINQSMIDPVPGFADDIPAWIHTFEFVYLIVIASFGIPGNTLIILVQSKNRVKSSTDFLVITMAIVELLCSSFNITLYVCYQVSSVWIVIANDFVCCFHKFTIYLTSISSIFLLTAIAMDRYFQTCMPLSSLHNKDKAKKACIIVNVCSILLSIPALCTYELDVYMECSRNGLNAHIMYIIDCIYAVMFIVMFVIVSVSYVKITLMLKRRHKIRVEAKFPTNSSNDKDDIFAPESIGQSLSGGQQRASSNKIAPEPIIVKVTPSTLNPSASRASSPPSSSLKDVEIIEQEEAKANGVNKAIPMKTFQRFNTRMWMPDSDTMLGSEPYQTRTKRNADLKNDSYQRKQTHVTGLSQQTIKAKINEQGNTEEEAESHFEKAAKERAMRILRLEENRLNRTTLIMSLITLVYIISWAVNWVVMIFLNKETLLGRIFIHMTKTSFMINCITNPVFYMCMSSRFRDNAIKIVCRR